MEKFQEFLRVVDATLFNFDEENGQNGQNAFCFVKMISEMPKFEETLGIENANYVKEQIEIAGKKTGNVREQIKKIWMYPNMEYPPWDNVNYIIPRPFPSFDFEIELVNGKVFAVCKSFPNLTDVVFAEFMAHDVLTKDYQKNSETCHITLVNSNVVADIGIKEVQKFLDSYSEKNFSTTPGKIKSTTSKDWARFSKCYVVEITSEECRHFIEAFNIHFKKELKIPTTHVTFAIKPRDLLL